MNTLKSTWGWHIDPIAICAPDCWYCQDVRYTPIPTRNYVRIFGAGAPNRKEMRKDLALDDRLSNWKRLDRHPTKGTPKRPSAWERYEQRQNDLEKNKKLKGGKNVENK